MTGLLVTQLHLRMTTKLSPRPRWMKGWFGVSSFILRAKHSWSIVFTHMHVGVYVACAIEAATRLWLAACGS